MTKHLILAIMALSFGLNSFAQDAKSILDKLSTKTKAYTSISANYESKLTDQRKGDIDSQKGRIQTRGNMYNLDLPDYVIMSDGENVWTYEKGTNTCYIDYLEDVADEAINPGELFTIWEQDFKYEMKGETPINGSTAYHINLYPNTPADKAFHTIQLFIDKSKMEIVKIVVKGREGDTMTYSVSKFTPNVDLPDSTFKFDTTDYPGVEIIDQRL